MIDNHTDGISILSLSMDSFFADNDLDILIAHNHIPVVIMKRQGLSVGRRLTLCPGLEMETYYMDEYFIDNGFYDIPPLEAVKTLPPVASIRKVVRESNDVFFMLLDRTERLSIKQLESVNECLKQELLHVSHNRTCGVYDDSEPSREAFMSKLHQALLS